MYEISLVPDVKAELLRKIKMRNMVILICVIVAAACGGIFLILLGVTGGQGLKLAAQDTEMACRSDGTLRSGRCDSKYGTSIMRFRNAEELLTIQKQMSNISLLNDNKVKLSRVFGIMDVILPTGENKVQISELRTDFDDNSLYFDAVANASNNIGYSALEAFKKNAQRSYFDYGNYMRYDADAGEYVAIPSYCITETTDSNGVTFGVYHKGNPGCEAPMVEKEASDSSDEEEATTQAETKPVEKKDIRIRRTYNDEADMEKYRSGTDNYNKNSGAETVKGYYFESSCLKYSDGKFDEAATIEACQLLSDDPLIGDSSYGKTTEGTMVLSFSASLSINRNVFLSKNKHVKVIGPSRQNVTDSYIQVRDMFTAGVDDNDGEDK